MKVKVKLIIKVNPCNEQVDYRKHIRNFEKSVMANIAIQVRPHTARLEFHEKEIIIAVD